MKRILLVAVSSSALALAAPGMAVAHHHHAKHHSKHSKHHKRHAARARVLTFRAASAPATTPTTPTSTESAGKVASFKAGVLTITLNDGTQVSGKVTENTEIHCPSGTAPPTNDGDDDDNDEHGSSDNGQFAHSSSAHGSCDGEKGHASSQSCTTAALVEGALVREAELKIGPSGAVWDHVDLM
jgi:hypothetical protein